MTETEKAYYAGLFDGEGYLGINPNGKPWRDRPVYLKPQVVISMKASDSKLVLERAKELWGGSLFNRKPRLNNHHWVLTWSLFTKGAEKFLCDIYPYLVVKKEQAEIVFQFRALQIKGKNRISIKEQLVRINLRDKLKQLHHI